jgi:hypothetical protein
MRCPKCGYISFDKEEVCRGCKKNIAKFSLELSGVVLRSEVPDFLWFEKPEEEEPEEDAEEESTEADSDEVDVASSADLGENTVEFAADGGDELDASLAEEGKEIEFDLSSDGGGAEEEAKNEIEFDLSLSDAEEKTPAPEPAPAKKEGKKDSGLDLSMESSGGSDLDLGLEGLDFDLDDSTGATNSAPKSEKLAKPVAAKQEKAPAKSAKEPLLDLSGLDLSGLMPPAAEGEKTDFSFSGIGELSLENEGGKAAGKTAGKKEKTKSTDALPDLSMDGLDLSSPILPPAASAAGKKLRPAAKTGTALDDFNIDLGDLLSGTGDGKKKK